MEKNSPVLTELKPDFYNVLLEYLKNLDNRLDRETSAQKQILLKDEIQNTKKIATNIYEQREKKILLAAISKARGGNPDLKNMVNIEKNLFDTILDAIETSRKQFFKKEQIEKKTTEQKKELIKPKKPDENKKNSNPIIIVTEDVPEFIGTNEKKYNLRKNDILSLPDDMCNMLFRRGVVKKINH